MSSIKLDMFFEPGSMEELRKQMERRRTLCGDSAEDVIRIGTIAALQALQSSTKVAPQRRKVRLPSKESGARKIRVARNRMFIAEGINRDTGGPKNIVIFAPDLACAKLHPKAQIKKWGLAKSSWGWAMHRLFAVRAQGVRGELSEPDGSIEVLKIIDRVNGFAQANIDNRLKYMDSALSGGRGQSLSTAMTRAANVMRSRIDRIIKQASMEVG
jgi:hypothetical protein